MEAVILAGGLGSRLKEQTRETPKPMLPVRDRPFLAWLMDYWIREGVKRFILSVSYKREVIRSFFGDSYEGIPVAYSEEDEPLGTGGALLQAEAYLEGAGPFLAVNGDTFFEVPLKDMLAFHRARQAGATLALVKGAEGGRYEKVLLNQDGQIEALLGRDEESTSLLTNGGVYLLNPGWQTPLKMEAGDRASLEADLLPGLLKAGAPLFGFVCERRFLDIGTPEDYAKAPEIINSL